MQRILFARIELWIVLLLALLALLGVLLFGALVLDGTKVDTRFGAAAKVAVAAAGIPETLEKVAKGDHSMEAERPLRFADRPAGWTVKGGPLPGYLLLSRYDGDLRRHVVELVALADMSVRHRWMPDADTLLPRDHPPSEIADYTLWTTRHYRVIHPYLTPGGALVIKDHQSHLYAVDACGARIWGQEQRLFHHSTESDGAGGWWVPGYIEPSGIERTTPGFHEDSLVHIGPDGEILSELSVTGIFMRHGLEPRIFTAGRFDDDPIHMNDIQPVLADGPYWKAGDLFLSFRLQSTVMLYRPSTDEIVWMKEGPWMAQHDVDIIDDHRIAVFNNNAFDRGSGPRIQGSNLIEIYDFATDTVSDAWHPATARPEARTLFEGLFTRLPDGTLMVEEENSGRLLFATPEGEVRAEFINQGTDGLGYRMGWSRWMSTDEAEAALSRLSGTACDG